MSSPVTETRGIIHELQGLWFGRVPRDQFKTRKVSIGRLVFAVTANAFSKSRALDVLWNEGMWTESIPIVRTCFESALYAAWIQQVGRAGVPEVLAALARTGDLLRQELEKADVAIPSELAAAVKSNHREHESRQQQRRRIPSASRRINELAKVEQLCASLGGPGLYYFYRHLSGGSHALGTMANHVRPDSNGDVIHHLMPDAAEREADGLTATVAYSLLWAIRAWSEASVGKPVKRELKAIARRLDVPPLLTYMPPPKSARTRRSRLRGGG